MSSAEQGLRGPVISRVAPPARKPIADADVANGNAARGEVLAQRSVEQRVSARDEVLNRLGGNHEDGFTRTTVYRGMGVKIAFDTSGVMRPPEMARFGRPPSEILT